MKNPQPILLLTLFFTLLFCSQSTTLAQGPIIILDHNNAEHIIEFHEWEEFTNTGPAFSLINFNEGLLWVSYEGGGSGGRYLMHEKGRFRLKLAENSKNIHNNIEFQPLGSEKSVYGPVSTASESGKLFVTANQARGWQGRTRLGIFIVDNETGKTAPLPFIHARYNYMHPAWDELENRLVFSSDFGSEGQQMDLYYSVKHNEGWSEPVKLDGVNSSTANDVFPHVTPEGLFFSSDRPSGPGGLDIYYAERNSAGFELPKLLAAPFNTSSDDFGIYINEEGNGGHLSSNRPGSKSGDKIFKFNCSLSCFQEGNVSKTLDVLVVSAEQGNALRGVEVVKMPESVFLEHIRAGNLGFDPVQNSLNLDVKAILETSSLHRKCISSREGRCLLESRTNEKNFIVFLMGEGRQPVMHRIEFGDGFDHQTLELAMEADCKPIAISVVCPEGDSIEDPVVIIENLATSETDSMLIPNLKYQDCLGLSKQYLITAFATERRAARKIIHASNVTPEHLELVLEKEEIEVVREGTVLELENIYYEYNSHLISPGAAAELDELASIMVKDSTMEIELRAHTDSRGSELYNLQLSQRRAQSAKEHLVQAGIDPSRIRTVGLGESQLRNHCSPGVQCTEEEHAFNRRTEVVVIQAGEGVRAIRKNGQLRFIIY